MSHFECGFDRRFWRSKAVHYENSFDDIIIIIMPHFTIQLCIWYRGIFHTIPLYLELKINIFWQVSGVKSKLVWISDVDIFEILDV